MEIKWSKDAGASAKNKKAHGYAPDETGNAFQLCGGEYVQGPKSKRNPFGRVSFSKLLETSGEKCKNCQNVANKLNKKNPPK